MNFKDIVTIGSMVLGVIIFIIVLFTEKTKRKRLQKEFAELKKSVQQDATKTDIELRMKQLKETAKKWGADRTIAYTPDDIDKDFYEKNKEILCQNHYILQRSPAWRRNLQKR